MPEILITAASAVIMTVLYSRTPHPKLYAFMGALSGAASLIAGEIWLTGTAAGITVYEAALSVIYGAAGTALNLFLKMLWG